MCFPIIFKQIIMRGIIVLLFGLIYVCSTFAQSGEEMPFSEVDTIPSAPIRFTTTSASEYIINLMDGDHLWRGAGEPMQLSLSRLVDHYNEPFDSVETRLFRFNYDAIEPRLTDIVRSDTLPVRWLNEAVFIIDTLALGKEPFITRKTYVMNAVDSAAFSAIDTIPDIRNLVDSILQVRDTITEVFIDSLYLESKNIQLHQIVDNRISPPLIPPDINKEVRFLPDSANIVISETTRAFVANRESPFYIVPGEMMPDSLRYAVETLLHYTDNRDSIPLFISDTNGQRVPFWLTTGEDELIRYWVRNHENDSITIWIGNPSKQDITLTLEEDVSVERMEKVMADNIPVASIEPRRLLASLKPLEEIPVFWQYGLSSALTLNQTYLSNWARGGENFLSSMIDMRATARYTNTDKEITWNNMGRLRYGTIISEEHGLRTNTDNLELSSQYNKALREKIDFSSVFYMKTQVAKGYKYPNDSVPVSKFLNPGTFTIGVGFEYKPFKNTLFNFSPLSYKNTFVLDTVNINQGIHGIEPDRRSRQELGGQLVIRNRVTILDDLNISNSVRLFSGYLDKPQNMDVDWEINIDKQISWYFMVRLNLHFIYDENIRFPVLDNNDEPVLLPDGSEKKVPRLQFKQFLGLTLAFTI